MTVQLTAEQMVTLVRDGYVAHDVGKNFPCAKGDHLTAQNDDTMVTEVLVKSVQPFFGNRMLVLEFIPD